MTASVTEPSQKTSTRRFITVAHWRVHAWAASSYAAAPRPATRARPRVRTKASHVSRALRLLDGMDLRALDPAEPCEQSLGRRLITPLPLELSEIVEHALEA